MRLTSFTDFGLRALMRLAATPGALMTNDALAAALGVSRNHLAKVLQDLGAAGYVRTVRGVHGGVALAQPAGAIRIGDVVRRLERDQPMVECFRPDGGACCLMPDCRLRGMLATAHAAFMDSLNAFTLADCALRHAA
ncbi:MAG TPA: Rrf2 family transcriptional regulator [Acetobacteraceae bacterium]|nr:Rrf2 family transcriptional regulator [Acetobacteraceae bacterium]